MAGIDMLACVYCSDSVRANQPGVVVEVKGWSTHRTQGGQNHVIERQETGRYAHYACLIGVEEDAQGTLL